MLGIQAKTLRQVARSNDVELEAVCEGQLACATWYLALAPE